MEEILQIFKLLAIVANIVGSAIETATVVVLAAQLVIREHAVAIFHRENFIIDSAEITILVAKVVKLLTELSNEEILFAGTDFDTRFLKAKTDLVRIPS